jgi:uncharacterized protein YkuJ
MVLKSLDGQSLNKQMSTYDNNGNESSRTYYIRDKKNNDWLKYMEYTYERDHSGNQISEIAFMQDTASNQWVGVSNQLFLFDENGNEIEKVCYGWNRQTGDWETNHKCVTGFDEDGVMENDISYIGIENQWVEYSQKDYKYEFDNAGNIVEMLIFDLKYKDVKSNVNASKKYEYAYDKQGNLTLSVLYERSDESQWVPKYRYEYEFDSNDNQTLEIFLVGDPDYDGWRAHYKYGHSYDEDGNLISMFYYSWNMDKQDWVGVYNYQYFYDSDKNSEYINLYVWENGDWRFNERADYYYTVRQNPENNTRVSEKLTASVYPNPVAGFFTVAGAEHSNLIIVDMQGRVLLTRKNISNQEVVQAGSWPNGAYFIILNKGDEKISRKILKK